jgi:predicted nuclease of predicted toxin-antitoxin system
VKLLLDEMLSPDIAENLRARGHDVQSIKGSPHERLSDSDVMDLARSEQRAVVTNNLQDFRPLHNAAVVPGGPGHFGMVFMPSNYRRTKSDIGRITDRLDEILQQHLGVDALRNGETWM